MNLRRTQMLLTAVGMLVMGAMEILQCSDAGQKQGRETGLLDHLSSGLDPVPVGMRAEAVVERRAGQAVAMRHFDRGWRQPDERQFDHAEYVFGATAAAALYRRDMIEDISIQGEFYDPDFFIYREDADVAWRAQLMGWKCMYAPYARGYHVRKVLPGNRRALPPINHKGWLPTPNRRPRPARR